MNIEFVKDDFKNKINKKVRVTVYGLRNKINYYEGIINNVYPNIFTIKSDNKELSFAYRDIITKDITIKFL